MLECQFLVFWLLQHESFVIMKLFQFSEFAGDRFPNRTSWEVGVGRFGKECTAPLGLAVHFFQGAFVFSSYLGKLYISLDHPYSAKKDAKTLNIKLRQNTHSCRQAQARSRAHTHTHARMRAPTQIHRHTWCPRPVKKRSGSFNVNCHRSSFLTASMSQLQTSLCLSKDMSVIN